MSHIKDIVRRMKSLSDRMKRLHEDFKNYTEEYMGEPDEVERLMGECNRLSDFSKDRSNKVSELLQQRERLHDVLMEIKNRGMSWNLHQKHTEIEDFCVGQFGGCAGCIAEALLKEMSY